MAILTKDIWGCSGGALEPSLFEAGSWCPPDLRDAAREMGALQEFPEGGVAEPAPAPAAAPKRRARARAPETKAGAGGAA